MDERDEGGTSKGDDGATRPSSHPPPSTSKRIPQTHRRLESLDEATLARHRDAQRAAISAASLGGRSGKDSGGRAKQIFLSMVAGTALGVGVVAGYWKYVQAQSPPPVPVRPAPTTSEPVAEPPDPVEEPDLEASAEPQDGAGGAPGEEGDDAPRTVTVKPATAGVMVDGKPVKLTDGTFVLEGDVGTKHNVIITVGTRSRPFSVEITEGGPTPPVLDLISGLPATGPAPPPSPPPAPPPGGRPPPVAPPAPAPAPAGGDFYE